MRKKYEKPSLKEVEIELSQCIANSDFKVDKASSGHSNVNGAELEEDVWGEVVDITPKNRGSRW